MSANNEPSDPKPAVNLTPPTSQGVGGPSPANPTGTANLSYKGPYLTPNGGVANTGIPANPFGDPTAALTTHWTYSNADGSVISAISGTTLDNAQPYTQL